MRLRILTIVVTPLIIGSFFTARASCWLPDVTKGLELAKAVFIGEVEEITPPRSSGKDADFFERAHRIRFKVERSWKGQPFGSVEVWTLQGDYFSALPRISKGERYLVYAESVYAKEKETSELLMSACSRTALLPADTSPQPAFTFDYGFDRKNGARDVRALDALMFLKRR